MHRFWHLMVVVTAVLAGAGALTACPKQHPQPAYGAPPVAAPPQPAPAQQSAPEAVSTAPAPPSPAAVPDTASASVATAAPAPGVKSFTCTPAGPIHMRDMLTLKAELEPLQAATVEVAAEQLPTAGFMFQVRLADDGAAPDIAAGDNVYAASVPWGLEFGYGKAVLKLTATGTVDGKPATRSAEIPLEILPPEPAG